MTQFCSAERKFWRDKIISKFNGKGLGTAAEQKQQLILLQGLLLCWDFTQPRPFPNYTCRLHSFLTHCKRHKKEKKLLEWATELCSILDTAKKSLTEYLGQRPQGPFQTFGRFSPCVDKTKIQTNEFLPPAVS